jgi:hypothetical protein
MRNIPVPHTIVRLPTGLENDIIASAQCAVWIREIRCSEFDIQNDWNNE